MKYLFLSILFIWGCNRPNSKATEPTTSAAVVVDTTTTVAISDSLSCSENYRLKNKEGVYEFTIPQGCITAGTLKLQEKKDALNNLKESLIGLGLGASGHSFYGFEKVLVNGKPYTGTLLGYDKNSGKTKILELELKNGLRDGDLKIWEGVILELHYVYQKNERIETIRTKQPEPDKKPIIYLYPEEKTTVNIQLEYQGNLTTTYPKYNAQKGWTVEAQPNGTLIDPETQKEYYGLYWEGESHWTYDLSTGFVVKGKEAAEFLDDKLAQLGLTRREANEFIVYWLPQLEQNEYNLIHFAQEDYQTIAKLNISPQPKTLIRVFMIFQGLKQPINIIEQELPTIQRKGFTVVEWGGRASAKNTIDE